MPILLNFVILNFNRSALRVSCH